MFVEIRSTFLNTSDSGSLPVHRNPTIVLNAPEIQLNILNVETLNLTCSQKSRSTFLNASLSGSFISAVNVPFIVADPGNSVVTDISLLLPPVHVRWKKNKLKYHLKTIRSRFFKEKSQIFRIMSLLQYFLVAFASTCWKDPSFWLPFTSKDQT